MVSYGCVVLCVVRWALTSMRHLRNLCIESNVVWCLTQFTLGQYMCRKTLMMCFDIVIFYHSAGRLALIVLSSRAGGVCTEGNTG